MLACDTLGCKLAGYVIYDNNMGVSDTGDPMTALGGGSIVPPKAIR